MALDPLGNNEPPTEKEPLMETCYLCGGDTDATFLWCAKHECYTGVLPGDTGALRAYGYDWCVLCDTNEHSEGDKFTLKKCPRCKGEGEVLYEE